MKAFTYCLVIILGLTQAVAQEAPNNHVDPTTLSPDGRYGITVLDSSVEQQADGSYADVKNPQNVILEVKSANRVGVIEVTRPSST